LFNVLYLIKKLSYISCLELTPGKNGQYVRSSGTKARLFKFDNETKTALLYLPSKTKKFFSQHSVALCDQTALPEKKRLKNTKAGY
jgi:ribosomal protein L2